MFCGRTTNDEINRVHKRALRVLLNDYDSSFEELLHRNEEVTIHAKNLQKLMLEVYRCVTSRNPSFLREFFIKKGVIHLVRTHEGGDGGSSKCVRMRIRGEGGVGT